MNGLIKHLGTFSVLSIASILAISGFVDESNAASASRTIHQYAPVSDKVCGDRLCSETGGKIFMLWEKISSEAIQQNCSISNSQDECEETIDTQIEEATIDTQIEEATIDTQIEEATIDTQIEEATSGINSEIDEIKNYPWINVHSDDIISINSTNIPVTIPLHQGYYMRKVVYYIITDSSDSALADMITKNYDWKVNLAPSLANATKDAVSKTNIFFKTI